MKENKYVVIPPPYGLYWQDISNHLSNLFGGESMTWFGTGENSLINLFYTCPNKKTPYFVFWSSGLSDTQDNGDSPRREFVLYIRNTLDVVEKMQEIHAVMNTLTALHQTKQVSIIPGASINISKGKWLLIAETYLPGGVVPIICQDDSLVEFYQLIVVTTEERNRIVSRNKDMCKKKMEMFQVMNPACLIANALDFQLDEMNEY